MGSRNPLKICVAQGDADAGRSTLDSDKMKGAGQAVTYLECPHVSHHPDQSAWPQNPFCFSSSCPSPALRTSFSPELEGICTTHKWRKINLSVVNKMLLSTVPNERTSETTKIQV